MNISKFTQKSMEAVERCQKLAYEYGNQEIEEEHLLYGLLTIEDSLILKLIEKMGIQKEHFVNRAEEAVAKRVKVQGGQVYVGKDLNVVLTSAERCVEETAFHTSGQNTNIAFDTILSVTDAPSILTVTGLGGNFLYSDVGMSVYQIG